MAASSYDAAIVLFLLAAAIAAPMVFGPCLVNVCN
jgi:hypothetical protein